MRRLKLLPVAALIGLIGCAEHYRVRAPAPPITLSDDTPQGDTTPVHDPAIMRQGSTWYVFATDGRVQPDGPRLPIRCSQDRTLWTHCGEVFAQPPAWIVAKVPGARGFWAPDISFFNGLYHVYYAASTLGSQQSVIGLATNVTLDAGDPRYKWEDRGEVLESHPGMAFNAIDPNILVDGKRVWMTWGSFWGGIHQQQIDPASGMLVANTKPVAIAARPDTKSHAIEGPSIIRHGRYYYLFVAIDHCCERDFHNDDYKEAVGRATSPNGPFVDRSGRAMLEGGLEVLLTGNATWLAPGGATAYVDQHGDAWLVFHALDAQHNGASHLWLKRLNWVNDWPVVTP